MPVRSAVRCRLEAQGYRGLDDATLEQLAPWLRWSPALCTIAIVIGVATRSPVVLCSIAGIAL
ncbi:hypothetical protein, partial [Nocardia sp. NPDC058497]|uniref:hypothetical protein n=1 Tax=Nocardia sp. NPDC058497 TaxID=3346529 RepID=UPI0036621634